MGSLCSKKEDDNVETLNNQQINEENNDLIKYATTPQISIKNGCEDIVYKNFGADLDTLKNKDADDLISSLNVTEDSEKKTDECDSENQNKEIRQLKVRSLLTPETETKKYAYFSLPITLCNDKLSFNFEDSVI
ncbi:hypothetical protein A3Q56_02466 [Intoshia linei]|uniref:Uncharacterized protein n=1 Tax=Intoshia linei TaxID=1819745 RepID=A0A177B6A4_9BILA|nr:hypothetical protein A3Q56_02466 [Intoshia linei]